jgi:hypothetical protein
MQTIKFQHPLEMREKMRKEFLKQEKWNIGLFLSAMIIGYISSVILIGGPVTYSAPIGALTGFLVFQSWNYRQFKKEWKSKKRGEWWEVNKRRLF